MPRGGRRDNPGGRPRSPERRKAHAVYLFDLEYRATMAALEPHETWQDFAREALASEVKRRERVMKGGE